MSKQISQRYPRRGAMLKTPFEPLTDADFKQLVSSGVAVPGESGNALFVSKWRAGPGIDADKFLAAVRAQGSRLVVRRYKTDVNIKLVPAK